MARSAGGNASGAAQAAGTVSRSVLIGADARSAWAAVSRVMDLKPWVSGVRSVRAETRERGGVGAVRAIEFEDGSVVRERVVGWVEGSHLSYIMLDGLPLASYHATISVSPQGRRAARVTWRSHFGVARGGAARPSARLGALYSSSLAGLKRAVEGGRR